MTFKKLFAFGLVAVVLVACGDDASSGSVTGFNEDSSSSVCEDCDGLSSSSSVIASDASQSSDSKSSSSNNGGSGASVGMTSSSSSVTLSSSVASSSSEQSSSSVADVDPSTEVKGTMTDGRDGQTYKTVTIGTQTWMAENLNYETNGSFCYNDSIEYCAKYGRLYTWNAALNACPDGWHLPTQMEWKTLITAVGDSSTAGKMLKSTSGWICPKGDSRNGTDEYAFTALPVGIRFQEGYFSYEDINALFWASTESDGSYAYSVELYCGVDGASLYGNLKDYGFSVRCVKGEASVPVSSSSSSVSSSSEIDPTAPCKTETEDNCEYGTLTDERDGQTYKTVKIGGQWWMAENLNYAYLQPTATLDSSSFCYNDSVSYCEKYGRLYIWSAAIDSAGIWGDNGKGCGYKAECTLTRPVRGACPKGWHLPDVSEYYTMRDIVGCWNDEGKKLKSREGWYHENGLDAYGFTALPAGYIDAENLPYKYLEKGDATRFWCSSGFDSYTADNIFIWYGSDKALQKYSDLHMGLSVRCVRDEQDD